MQMVHMFRIDLMFIVLVLKPFSAQSLQWNHSHEDYGSLLNSLINVNEERMRTIDKMTKLNDYNFYGLLRTLLREKPGEGYAIVVVNEITDHSSKEGLKKLVPQNQNLVIPDKILRYGDSSDSAESFFYKDPKTYNKSDSIPMVRARQRCVYACRNAYRRVCRKFKYECSSRMRRYFRSECRDACERRF